MRHVANARTRAEAALATPNTLPLILAANTLLLFTIESQIGIPHWLKVAVTLFLSF